VVAGGDDGRALPRGTTAVPELALWGPGGPGRLRVRWYKLLSEMGTPQWVEALVGGRRPPLAIVGGSTTGLAKQLAERLKGVRDGGVAGLPLLLLTTATAD